MYFGVLVEPSIQLALDENARFRHLTQKNKKKQKKGKAFFSLYLFCFDGFIRCIME